MSNGCDERGACEKFILRVTSLLDYSDRLLGDEIDKLAANIALARDAAGVHFRSDSIEGLKLGESVGIALLADQSRTYNEAFDGFLLRRLNGARIRVSNGAVVPLPS